MFCRQAFRPALLATALTTLAAAMAAPAMAQTAPAAAGQNQGARLNFQIASGPLAGTLNAIAVQAGLVVSVDPALVDGKRAPAVQGRFTVGEALRQVLAGSGLELAMTGSGAISVRPAARITPPEVPTAALAPVVVRAAAYEGATTEDSGVALGRLDELLVHGTYGFQVLIDHAFHRAAPFRDVALHAADEADVGGSVERIRRRHHARRPRLRYADRERRPDDGKR